MPIGATEAIIIAGVVLLLLFIPLAAYLVLRDARRRGISEPVAFIFTLLVIFMLPVGLLLYLAFVLYRRRSVNGWRHSD